MTVQSPVEPGDVEWLESQRRGKAYVETNATIDRLLQALASYRPDGAATEGELVALIMQHMDGGGGQPAGPMPDDCEPSMFAGYLSYDAVNILARAILARLPALVGGDTEPSIEARLLAYQTAHDVALDIGFPSLTEALESLSEYMASAAVNRSPQPLVTEDDLAWGRRQLERERRDPKGWVPDAQPGVIETNARTDRLVAALSHLRAQRSEP